MEQVKHNEILLYEVDDVTNKVRLITKTIGPSVSASRLSAISLNSMILLQKVVQVVQS